MSCMGCNTDTVWIRQAPSSFSVCRLDIQLSFQIWIWHLHPKNLMLLQYINVGRKPWSPGNEVPTTVTHYAQQRRLCMPWNTRTPLAGPGMMSSCLSTSSSNYQRNISNQTEKKARMLAGTMLPTMTPNANPNFSLSSSGDTLVRLSSNLSK